MSTVRKTIIGWKLKRVLSRFDRSGIQWIQWNLLSHPLPLDSNCYDLVSLFDVLEHIPRPQHLLREAHRLLRPGGLLVIKVPNAANLRNRLRLFLQKARIPIPLRIGFRIASSDIIGR